MRSEGGRAEGSTGMIATIDVPVRWPLDLRLTLGSGQVFRWRECGLHRVCREGRCVWQGLAEHGSSGAGPAELQERVFCGVVKGRTVLVFPRERSLHVVTEPDPPGLGATLTAEDLSRYFSLDDDVPAVERSLASRHQGLGEVVRKNPGLRILRQDPWECLVSFILSVRNSIPAIERSLEALCRILGRPAGFGRNGYPAPADLARAGPEVFSEARCGFRGRFLRETAARIEAGEVDLQRVEHLPTERARAELMKLPGVGRKVADCVLLFAYHRLDVFPVDVWVKRAMARLFPETDRMTPAQVAAEGERLFSRFAGYAQEYLFWFERSAARFGRHQA